MDLIDRYLVAVRRHLPRPLQKDIVEELAGNLRSEAEEAEQRLGRALTTDDQSALLKKQGHPWLVASRYLPQQYLVGPALYPYYRQALVIVLFWVVLPISLGGGALAAIYAPDSHARLGQGPGRGVDRQPLFHRHRHDRLHGAREPAGPHHDARQVGSVLAARAS